MARSHGRCAIGERLIGRVPFGRWHTTTFIAGLREGGLTAPMVLDGAMNGPMFLAYIEKILLPTLNWGDTVIMDNVRTHKIEGVREMIESAGARLLYLPAYSPDLNPIELAFAKLKAFLRKASARTRHAILRSIRDALQTFAPQQCANFFVHDGYV